MKLTFDSSQISLETILEIFWALHDPTSLNRQGADEGVEYRSIILYSDEAQKKRIIASRDEVGQPLWPRPIVTEIKQLDTFFPAETEHQDYFNKHPEQAYCQIIINPKVAKLKRKFNYLLTELA